MLEMGRLAEALMQFHHCLNQQPELVAAKNQITKVWKVNNLKTTQTVPINLNIKFLPHDYE